MAKKQTRWGKKVFYVRDWRKVNEIYIDRATFYLDFEWAQSWESELALTNFQIH